jgi:sulfite exporter TauE/SafE
MLAAGLAVDRRTREDHASWLYACGLLALCGGLTTMHSESDASIALVALLQVGLVAISLLLERRSFAVAGALGLAAACGHLADDLLDAKALSFALTAIALSVIGLGLAYHLHHRRLEGWAARLVPARLRRLLPPGTRAGSTGR